MQWATDVSQSFATMDHGTRPPGKAGSETSPFFLLGSTLFENVWNISDRLKEGTDEDR